jgi:hypothetical protein
MMCILPAPLDNASIDDLNKLIERDDTLYPWRQMIHEREKRAITL